MAPPCSHILVSDFLYLYTWYIRSLLTRHMFLLIVVVHGFFLPSIFLDLLVARSVSWQETLYMYKHTSTYTASLDKIRCFPFLRISVFCACTRSVSAFLSMCARYMLCLLTRNNIYLLLCLSSFLVLCLAFFFHSFYIHFLDRVSLGMRRFAYASLRQHIQCLWTRST